MERPHLGHCDWEIVDADGATDERDAAIVVVIGHALTELGMPRDPSDPPVAGVCRDEHAVEFRVLDSVHHARPRAGEGAQWRFEQDAHPVAVVSCSRGADAGCAAHRPACTVGTDDIRGANLVRRAARCIGKSGDKSAVNGSNRGELRPVAHVCARRDRALGKDVFEVILRARPDVIGKRDTSELHSNERRTNRHDGLRLEPLSSDRILDVPTAKERHRVASNGCRAWMIHGIGPLFENERIDATFPEFHARGKSRRATSHDKHLDVHWAISLVRVLLRRPE